MAILGGLFFLMIFGTKITGSDIMRSPIMPSESEDEFREEREVWESEHFQSTGL